TMALFLREGIILSRPPTVSMPDDFPRELILDIGYAVRNVVWLISYNTRLVPPDRAPTSLEDLARPEWRGRLVLTDFITYWPVVMYLLIPLNQMWGEQKFWDWMRGVLANRPTWRSEPVPVMSAVEVGEAAVGLVVSSNLPPPISRNAPIAWVWINPMFGFSTPVSMASRAQNPNAARLFITYLVNEGGRVLQEVGEIPAVINPNYPTHTLVKSIPPNYKVQLGKILTDEELNKFTDRIRVVMGEIR
ncbi:MAG: ABC transporter substrate-binding protein, partial [Aigarchaeota archaeon]|nr:ABC transporter substrate-binding protein [Aigarchaeota archaeon]